MTDWFTTALAQYPRVAIAGGPKVGKSTLSNTVQDRPVIHTDDWIDKPWEDVPFIVIETCKNKPRFVVEGVQVPRALRNGLEVDAIIWLDHALAPLNARQVGMAKAVLSVFAGWRANNRHVPIIAAPLHWHASNCNTVGDR